MCKEARVKKKHCCQQNAFSATNALLKVRKCAEQPDHLRSEISSRALATLQIIGKAQSILKVLQQNSVFALCCTLIVRNAQ